MPPIYLMGCVPFDFLFFFDDEDGGALAMLLTPAADRTAVVDVESGRAFLSTNVGRVEVQIAPGDVGTLRAMLEAMR